MATKQVLFALASGLVIARDAFVAQSSSDIGATLATVRASNKPVKVIDNAAGFFNADNLLALIKANDMDYNLVAQQSGITLFAADVAAVQRAEQIAAEITKKMIPPYNFVEVPAGWSFADDVSFGPTKVRRKRPNGNGDAVTYALSPASIERLWHFAAKCWAEGKVTSTVAPFNVESNGTRRVPRVYATYVEAGCQTIRRYELEQIAKHKGWAFPAKA